MLRTERRKYKERKLNRGWEPAVPSPQVRITKVRDSVFILTQRVTAGVRGGNFRYLGCEELTEQETIEVDPLYRAMIVLAYKRTKARPK